MPKACIVVTCLEEDIIKFIILQPSLNISIRCSCLTNHFIQKRHENIIYCVIHVLSLYIFEVYHNFFFFDKHIISAFKFSQNFE
jgi:hypothetical protein